MLFFIGKQEMVETKRSVVETLSWVRSNSYRDSEIRRIFEPVLGFADNEGLDSRLTVKNLTI